MKVTAMVLTSVVLATFLFALEATQDRIPIFVRSAQAAGGFTDPSKDRQDSVKDLLRKLKDSDSVRPVESEGEALVVLEVLERETKRETNLWGRQNKSYLTVRLTARQASTPLNSPERAARRASSRAMALRPERS